MGTRKKSEDGEDGHTKNKKPNNFWAPFNTWWREHHERTGSRATVLEMREWYAQNAHLVWPPETMPGVEDMLKIAKGLRTIKQVQAYFRSYRKNLKTRKEVEPGSPESNYRRGARRHLAATRAVGAAAAGSFLAAVQQAAQHHQQMAAAADTGYTGAPDASAAGMESEAGDQLPFLEWGFSSEAAAAAAMEQAEAGGSDGDEQLSEAEEEAHAGTHANAQQHCGVEAGSLRSCREGLNPGFPPEGGLSGEAMHVCADVEAVAAGSPAPAAAEPGGPSAAAQSFFDAPWAMQPMQPHGVLLQPAAVTHRRILKAVRTSIGGASAPCAPDGSGGGAVVAAAAAAAAAAGAGPGGGLQAVTCRRTRIQHTSAGGLWKQEVVEEVEVGVGSSSMPYGMTLPPYHSMAQEGGAFVPGVPTAAHMAPPDAGMVWHGRSSVGGGSGSGGGGAAAAMAADASCTLLAPPRKQLRCGDRGVVSLGGGDLYAPSPRSTPQQDSGGDGCGGDLPQSDTPVGAGAAGTIDFPSGADAFHVPARRLLHSHGGHPHGYAARGGKVSGSHGGGGHVAMAISDGGVVYGSHPPAPPAQHPHAPAPAYRGAAGGSYGGMAPTWPHHPNAAPPPPPPHHQMYFPYHMYGFRNHMSGFLPLLPSYGYAHAGHAPHSVYPPLASYHLQPPYHPYGVQMPAYGQYYQHHPSEPAPSGDMADRVRELASDEPPPPQQLLPAQRPVRHMRQGLQHSHAPQQQQRPVPLPQHPACALAAADVTMAAAASVPQAAHACSDAPAPVAPPASQPYAPLPSAPPPQPQPLRLAELPPAHSPAGGLAVAAAGAVDPQLSNSDLGALSGLSALGLAESDVECEEEAASANQHAHGHGQLRAQHTAPAAEERLLAAQVSGGQKGEEEGKEGRQYPSAAGVMASNMAPALGNPQPPPHNPSELHSQLPQAQPPQQRQHQQCLASDLVAAAAAAAGAGTAAGSAVGGGSADLPAAAAVTPGPPRHVNRFVGNIAAAMAAAAAAAAAAAGVGAHHDRGGCDEAMEHMGEEGTAEGDEALDTTEEDSGFAAASDGGTTDGAASVYYKTPKVFGGKPLTPLPAPDSLLKSAFHPYHHGLLLEGAGALAGPFTAGLAAGGASRGVSYDGGGGAYRGPRSGGSKPMTIHVLQEEVMMMPHLAGLGTLGDFAALHSPTGSLNLELLDQAVEDVVEGMEVGVWGPCG